MSVVKRGSRWHIDIWIKDENGKRHRLRRTTGPGTTRKQALEIQKELRRASSNVLSQLNLIPDNKAYVAFSGFAKFWYDTYVIPNNKYSEQVTKEMILRKHLVPFFQDTNLRDIKSLRIEEYKSEKIKEELNKKTINNHLAVLRKLLNCAVDWEYLDVNPMNRVKPLKLSPPNFDFFNSDETELFLNKAEESDSFWFVFFLVAFRTGARVGEILALKWEDLDFANNNICIRRNVWGGKYSSPKGNKNRTIPMTEQVRKTLLEHRHLKSEFVFCHDDGSVLKHDNIRWPLHRICRLAGLRAIRPHDIRHSFASQLVIKGAPLKVIQELLGHSDIQTTMRYAHLASGVKKEVLNLLETQNESNLCHKMVNIKITDAI